METQAVRVLVIEDDPHLCRLLVKYLESERYLVDSVSDGAEAVNRARSFLPDVVVLDLGLPGMDGVEVCREIRRFSECYIIMLTARSDEVDKLIGLTIGADDYMTKPFGHRELLARIKVMLRRPRQVTATGAGEVLTVGPLRIEPGVREVRHGDQLLDVTPTEFDLLVTLASNPRRVLSRRQLIDAVWGLSWVADERMVDVHIRNLRRKLGDDANSPRFILTVRGAGYRIGNGS
ncbi:MAG TPA: response regulator transcription factor [Kineosporiaceae bacterium]